MTTLSERPLSRARAWMCVLTNQLATPGLGSLMAGRKIAGTFQLLVALAGFFLLCAWIFEISYRAFSEQFGETVSQASTAWMGKWGAILFGASWLWSLVTSISLLRQAKMEEKLRGQNVPPKL